MSQTVFTEKEAKNNFGRVLDEARRSPVTIKKNGRNYKVSYEDHAYLDDAIDAYWGKRALKAHNEGYLTIAQSNKLIRSILNA